MIVYSGLKSDFISSVEDDRITDEILDSLKTKTGRTSAPNEIRSWNNSMQFMYKVMKDDDIPANSGIAIEYNIPQSAKRVDFMISGYNSVDKPEMVVIELKQWDSVKKVPGLDGLVETYTGNGIRRVVHPSYQAWSYAQLISDFNEAVQNENIEISPCAYLHNYRTNSSYDPLFDPQYDLYLKAAPAFTSGHVSDLRAFIKKYVKTGDDRKVLYQLDNGAIRPSKKLQDSISSMLRGNKEFVMIDEQKVAFEDILHLSLKSQRDHRKRTIICKGGPGTGKSVIAVNLLAELTKHDQVVCYVSKNEAPRKVYLKKLRNGVHLSGVDNLFKGSACFTESNLNTFHTLITDEAHRLEKRSQYTSDNGNRNQIREIIHSSCCSVFFIDEHQRVTTSDFGSIDEIKRQAAVEGSEVFELELVSQFRCNGSNGYLAWIDNLLEIRETANPTLDGLDYNVVLCDSPEELRTHILEKNKEANRARIVAGYCWDWNKEKQNDPDYHDIKIGDFEISWNLRDQIYALAESSVNEAGCIHTTQGLEFDYIGVIMGDDIRYENGHVVTDFTRRASTDNSIKGLKTMYKKNPKEALALADEIIKNTYRTLMTRGMKGCFIYCTDPGMQEHIRQSLRTINNSNR